MKNRFRLLAVFLPVFLLTGNGHNLLGQANYAAMANNFIAKGASLGPPGGLNYLLAENPSYGARGCAQKVAQTDPQAAAYIMLRIAQTLVTFARTTRQTQPSLNPRDPTKPFRDSYYQRAQDQISLANSFLQKLAKSQPQNACTAAIDIAQFFLASKPKDEAYASNYLQRAKLNLYSSGSFSARYFASMIKDRAQRQTFLNLVETKRRTMGL